MRAANRVALTNDGPKKSNICTIVKKNMRNNMYVHQNFKLDHLKPQKWIGSGKKPYLYSQSIEILTALSDMN